MNVANDYEYTFNLFLVVVVVVANLFSKNLRKLGEECRPELGQVLLDSREQVLQGPQLALHRVSRALAQQHHSDSDDLNNLKSAIKRQLKH